MKNIDLSGVHILSVDPIAASDSWFPGYSCGLVTGQKHNQVVEFDAIIIDLLCVLLLVDMFLIKLNLISFVAGDVLVCRQCNEFTHLGWRFTNSSGGRC